LLWKTLIRFVARAGKTIKSDKVKLPRVYEEKAPTKHKGNVGYNIFKSQMRKVPSSLRGPQPGPMIFIRSLLDNLELDWLCHKKNVARG